MSASVGVVLNTLNLGWNAIFEPTKINDSIVVLMATPAVAGRNTTKVVTASGGRLRLHKTSKRLALVEVGMDNLDHGTLPGGGWLHFYDRHD
jgi:hypothetical protein